MAARGGNVFHSSAWAQYRRVRDGVTPLFVRWRTAAQDEAPVAMALGLQSPDPATLRGRLASRLEFDSSPATAHESPDLVAPLLRWCREERSIVEVRCGSFDGEWTPVPMRGRRARIEFLISPGDEATLFKRMRKGARSSVKRARRLGVEVTRRSNRAGALAFAGLHTATLRRLREHQRLSGRIPDESALASELEVLISRGVGQAYVARSEGEDLAGCFFGAFGESTYYLLSGAEPRAHELGALGLTLFVAVEEASREGRTRLNLGGVSGEAAEPGATDHGLYSFKKGLGAEPVARTTWTASVRPLRRGVAMGVQKALSAVR